MEHTTRRGRFIVFEGIDGSGKTTQTKRLEAHLAAQGRTVLLTAEPTKLPTGRALRDALAGRVKKSECEMAALFVEDRVAHNNDPEEGIRVMLERGVDVICDRYYYSSLAYQGQATDYAWVKAMNLNCPDILRPDICIYLDLLPHQSLARIRQGRDAVEIYENEETLARVRNTFLHVIEDLRERDHIAVVNAFRSPEEIAEEIAALVDAL